MTFDEKVERVETLITWMYLGEDYRWDQKGLTLQHGNQNGHNGWKASANLYRHSADGDTQEMAVDRLLVQLEEAFKKYASNVQMKMDALNKVLEAEQKR